MPQSAEAIRRSQEIQQHIRSLISNAYYNARNAGKTMEDAAHKASTDVMLYLIDNGIVENPGVSWGDTRGAERY